jgi:hypothetical protein
MSWGLSTIVLSSHELYMATKPVYFKCLPLLGIQRHIELPWQTLPESFQGIGLPNFALHSLAAKLQLIQCIWGFKDAASISLLMGFEMFLMEIGMYDNPFNNDYSHFSLLVMDGTWFKNLWELMHDFNITALFSKEIHLHPIRHILSLLMHKFSKHFRGMDLTALNVFRQHKKVIYLSCIVHCDGRTIDRDILTPAEGWSTHHKFPLQRPSQTDHALWIRAICRISSTYFSLPTPLGTLMAIPHKCFNWTTNVDGTVLPFENVIGNSTVFTIYYPSTSTRARAGKRFDRSHAHCTSPLLFYASITHFTYTCVFLHSWMEAFTPQDAGGLTLF